MPVVPMSAQPKRQAQTMPIPDSKYLMMALAMMRGEGKVKPPSSEQGTPDPASAFQPISPQSVLK